MSANSRPLGRGLRAVLIALGMLGLAWGVIYFTTIRPARLRSKKVEAAAKAQKKADKKALRPAQAVVARSGLPNLRQKMAAQKPVKVAFIGGSITQNGGAGGFVDMIPAWIESRARGVKVTTVNSGLAATGSDFGAKRIDRDVLAHRPDLVVVEFAVNDASRECVADMERLVRKIRRANPRTDILFIYAVMDWSLPKLERGSFPKSVKQHEQVAAHYGIPTVALGYEAARRIRSGEWTWANFSPDSCHPTSDGYASYNRDLEAALPELLAVAPSGAQTLPPSLTPGLAEYPPLVRAEPPPAPAPMRDVAGNLAGETWELPVIGAQWIGEPEFPPGPQAVWRLFSRPLAESVDGTDRAAWKPARWFEEERSFTGRTSHPVARRESAGGSGFGANPTDGAVLTWRAPRAGTYLVRVSATGTEGVAGTAEGGAELRVVRFPVSDARGELLGVERIPLQPSAPLAWEQRAELGAGGVLAFVITAQRMEYIFVQDFRVTVGHFGPSPSP